MGITQASLKHEDLKDLLKSTKFDETEIEEFFKKFIKDHPNGLISIEEFKNMYSEKFPNGDASVFAENVFNCMDLNRDGELDFREFLIDKYISSRGEINQKIKMTFSLYDLDKNGFITIDEMKTVYISIQKALGKIPKGPKSERKKALNEIEKEAVKLFKYLDNNHDGRISYDEFWNGIMANKKLKEEVRENPKLFP